MTKRLCVVVVLTLGMWGCGDTRSALGPSPINAPLVPTTAPPSQTDGAIFGVVSAMTATGRVPLGDAELEMAVCPQRGPAPVSYVKVRTATDGSYRVPDMCRGETWVWVTKAGYTTQPNRPQCDGDCFIVVINGDTRLDIEMIKE